MRTDPRVDAYIAKAAPFARPILERIRSVAHKALPEGEEGIKWGMPHFLLQGKNVGGMSAFKAHCAFIVHGEEREGQDEGMGAYGKIAALDDLPSEAAMIAALRNAAGRVLKHGSATAGRKRRPKPEAQVPEDLARALAANPSAGRCFAEFAPSHRREYIEWITGAKRPATREKRLAQSVEWIALGRRRNWKYESC